MVAVLYVFANLVPFKNTLAALISYVTIGALCYLVAMLILPGGKRVLHELLQDCQSAFGVKAKLQDSPVALS